MAKNPKMRWAFQEVEAIRAPLLAFGSLMRWIPFDRLHLSWERNGGKWETRSFKTTDSAVKTKLNLSSNRKGHGFRVCESSLCYALPVVVWDDIQIFRRGTQVLVLVATAEVRHFFLNVWGRNKAERSLRRFERSVFFRFKTKPGDFEASLAGSVVCEYGRAHVPLSLTVFTWGDSAINSASFMVKIGQITFMPCKVRIFLGALITK